VQGKGKDESAIFVVARLLHFIAEFSAAGNHTPDRADAEQTFTVSHEELETGCARIRFACV